MDSIQISMQSDTMIQPSVTSTSAVSKHSSVGQQVMDQFAQMKTMLSSFLRPSQETTRTAFCNYMEALEDRYFQTFRNEAIILLICIQNRAEERIHQPQQPQQQTLSSSSSATSIFVPQTFQQPLQPAPAAREYILIIPDTQMPASQVIQPAQQSQLATKGLPSQLLMTYNQPFNPPSVAVSRQLSSAIFTTQPTPTCYFCSNQHHAASASAAASLASASTAVSRQQTAAVEPLYLPTIGPFRTTAVTHLNVLFRTT